MTINIGIADDQQLFLKSLGALINTFPSVKVILEASNGEDLLNKLTTMPELPSILLIDVNMPFLNGIQAAKAIAQKYPLIRMVALSMKDDDTTVINMIRAGCCAYLLKDIHPDELEKALLEINATGFYNADLSNINHRRLVRHEKDMESRRLTEKEKTFLQLSCSDLTYKQVAAKMYLSERTIDGYRESLFEKLKVQSRVGMVLEAIRLNLVSPDIIN
jgi:DNA-binding NarL/FixJ family response regulator